MEPLVLTQRALPFVRIALSVEGNRELVLKHSTLLRSTQLTFPLAQISPSPAFARRIALPWFVAATVFGLLFVGAVLNSGASEDPLVAQFGMILLGSVTVACLFNAMQMSSSSLHFKDANTGQELFSIFKGKPSSTEVERFVSELKSRIQSFRSPSGATTEQLAELYRKHLDYLLENEVLLKEEYDLIVKRLAERAARKRVVELVR